MNNLKTCAKWLIPKLSFIWVANTVVWLTYATIDAILPNPRHRRSVDRVWIEWFLQREYAILIYLAVTLVAAWFVWKYRTEFFVRVGRGGREW